MNKPTDHQALFSGFGEKTREEWVKIAIEDLKGADFSKKLVWNTPDGFPVDPFYTLEDRNDREYLENYHNALPSSFENPRSWQYLEQIFTGNEKKANVLAQESLLMGAQGIIFSVADQRKLDPAILFNDLDPNVNPVIFKSAGLPDRLIRSFLDHFTGLAAFPVEEISGGLSYDPLREYSLSENLNLAGIEGLALLMQDTDKMKDFRVLTINGNHFHDSGANTVHEIAFTLNLLVEYLDRFTETGIEPQQVVNNLRISLATGTSYFIEIAKLKAIRILFPHILDAFGVFQTRPEDLVIHCDTSLWTKTIYDPHVNMLRNTSEAMSAVLGGANSLTILPFDVVFNKSNGFSRRISRNISNLLRDESYFNKVIDPAAGSYYIEALTDKLIERSLDLFRQIETAGGYIKAFEKGLIQQQVAEAREKKYRSISSRRKVIVGTNQYANPAEKINPEEAELEDVDLSLSTLKIVPARAAHQFERLRLDTDRFAGENGEDKRPAVFLSLIGENKVMRKARATFAHGFFSCAGFRIRESSPSSSLFKSVQKAIDSNADLVVMCGSDEDYVASGADYARAYKANQKGILVVAGNPENIKESLLAAGVDDFIHIKTEVIESLRKFQMRMNIIKA